MVPVDGEVGNRVAPRRHDRGVLSGGLQMMIRTTARAGRGRRPGAGGSSGDLLSLIARAGRGAVRRRGRRRDRRASVRRWRGVCNWRGRMDGRGLRTRANSAEVTGGARGHIGPGGRHPRLVGAETNAS